MSEEHINASTSEFAREVGGAQSLPSAPPPTLGATPPCSLAQMTAGSRTLDRRLNPNAPVFVPDFKASQVAQKLFDQLSPYTRWSTASSEDLSYGPRYDSIWREASVQDPPVHPHPRFDYSLDPDEEEVVELEFDEHQAMNIGAESYDPKAGCTGISLAMEIREVVDDIPPQLEAELEAAIDADKRNRFQNRRSSKAAKACCLVM
ncbi:uncharacterized protein LOC108101142 [Drosophila ficusphila]|uniref:uncharacterized protein LOC108101142 n=1 Tax=Drosophila ficusphila TaxID=30025 RepID=UPI0007E65674|nr:uncharacterized protein LOC108101142 [Drosophila ficusphila]